MKKINILDFIDELEKIDLGQIKRVSNGDLAFLIDICKAISTEAQRVLDNSRKADQK